MKALLSLVAGGLILATGVVSIQSPLTARGASFAAQDNSALEPRVAALEQEIKTLQEENAMTRELLDSAVTYLEAQAKGSEAMLASLEVSETQGFTKGINYQSRETLLAAFRKYWKGVGTGLPGATPEEVPDPKQGRGRRR